MSQDNPIGLTELIKQIKRDLLSPESAEGGNVPLFSVDEVSLELQVTINRDVQGGLKIYVIELGGGVAREDIQTVKVTLTPLLSKEERIRLYKTHYPNLWPWIERANVDAGMKGDDEPLGNSYGS